MSAKPDIRTLKSVSAARDLVRRSRRLGRAPRRRHHLSPPKNAARRLSGAPDRPAASLGQGGAQPHLHGRAQRRRRLAADHLRAIADLEPAIASALLARGLSAEKPVVILSGNSIDHALIAFGALYAGIPFCPVSPAYSLVSKDYGKLAYLMKLLTPGLVFADDAGKIRRCAGSQCSRRDRDRGVARRGARPRRDDAGGSAGHARTSATSTRSMTRSVRTRSQSSC